MGPSAASLRERLLNLPNKQRQRVFQNMVADLVDGAVLNSAGMSDLKEFHGSLSLEYEFTVRAYAQHASGLFVFRPCVMGRKGRDLLEGQPRKQSVVFAHTASESDVVDISYPLGYAVDEIPQSVKYDYPFAAYKSETNFTEHALHYMRTYELKDVRVPLERLQDLRQFFREIASDERTFAILKVP